MRRSSLALSIGVALLAAACGNRLDEDAVRRAQATASESREASANDADARGAAAAGDGGGTTATTRLVRREGRAATVVGGSTGVSGDAIKVGGIFPLSGGLSALGRPVEQAARAYFRSVNEAGGVNGRRIDFIAEDDAADPNRTRTAAEKLVERDQVFVMGPSFTPFSPDLVPFLENKGVPFIGFDGVNVEGFTSPTTVSVGASIAPHARVLIPYWYEKTTAQRIGVVYLNVPPAISYLKETRDVICPKLGCQVVREQSVEFTTTDYTTILLGMQQANVQGIFIVTDPASAVKLLVQAKQLNYKPSPGGYLGQHGIYLDLVPESCGTFCDGLLAPTSLFPPQVKSAATDEMRRIVGRYYSDVEYGYFTELGYVSARVLVDLLRRAGTLDRAKVVDAARGLTAYDTGGFTNPAQPVDLSPGREHPRDMIIVRSDGGAWKQETGWLSPRRF
jgi:branched-chain amino acid transport system substrate-binding protein